MNVTDAGLKELAGLKDLQSLNLHHTQVTDAGMKELAGLKGLHTLRLDNTSITEGGLKELAGVNGPANAEPRIHPVNRREAKGTGIRLKVPAFPGPQPKHDNEAGLKELAGLKDLQTLSLDHTLVKDAGLKELAGLKDCDGCLSKIRLLGNRA